MNGNNHGGKRQGAGRKPAPIKLKAYSFKCSPEDYEQIKKNAIAEGLAVSAYIRKQCTNNSTITITD